MCASVDEHFKSFCFKCFFDMVGNPIFTVKFFKGSIIKIDKTMSLKMRPS